MSSPEPVQGAGNPLGHRMAASRLLLDDTPALAEQRRALLPPARDDRNAALVELNLTTGVGAAEVAQRFLERFASVFGDGPGGGPPLPQQISGYFRCWLRPPETKELLTADGRAGQSATIFRIWPDYVLRPHLDQSVSTITADAAQRVYAAAATFTSADRAVGWWYPMASALKHEDSQSASDLDYRWGGMGHDGYQQSGISTTKLAPPQHPYGFTAGTFYRLDSNAVIKADQSPVSGAHSDIVHPEVAWAAISAAGLG